MRCPDNRFTPVFEQACAQAAQRPAIDCYRAEAITSFNRAKNRSYISASVTVVVRESPLESQIVTLKRARTSVPPAALGRTATSAATLS